MVNNCPRFVDGVGFVAHGVVFMIKGISLLGAFHILARIKIPLLIVGVPWKVNFEMMCPFFLIDELSFSSFKW